MEIRKARSEDAERLALLASETFWEAYRNTSKLETTYIRAYMAKAFSVTQITSELKDESTKFLIAYANGAEAGYAKLVFGSRMDNLESVRPMEISRIYLGRSFWGKGLGKELLDHCVEQAVENECDSVWLGVWQHNDRAIGFYKKHGFEVVGEVEFDLASSLQKDHLMVKVLKKT